jgi:hypothetical protein
MSLSAQEWDDLLQQLRDRGEELLARFDEVMEAWRTQQDAWDRREAQEQVWDELNDSTLPPLSGF